MSSGADDYVSSGWTWHLDGEINIENVIIYSVTYTDGVEGQVLFADQTHKVVAGTQTPEFDGTPTREGYIFSGWKPEVSEYVTADVTYVAQWEEEKEGQVRYNLTLNGATIDDDTLEKTGGNFYTVKDQYFKSPDTFTVISTIPTHSDYAFVGWYDKDRTEDGGDGPTIRKAGDVLHFIYENDSKYTLDALWAQITADNETVLYDGKQHSIDDADLSYSCGDLDQEYIDQIVGNNLIQLSNVQYKEPGMDEWGDKPSYTDAGTYEIQIKGTVTVGSGTAAEEYILQTTATLVIEKRSVTLTSATDSKQYDGTPLTNDEVTVSGDGFAAGEGATYNVTGSQTIVGSSENYFTYELNAGTKAENYNITTSNGTLTVTSRDAKYEITVVANSGTEKYDGSEKRVSGLVTDTFEVEGNIYTVEGLSAEAAGTDAGTYPSNVTGTPVVKDSEGRDVTEQFAVSVVNGQLVINKRDVVLRSKDLTKQYDGRPLENGDEPLAIENGWAEGEGATYTFTGSQTLVGSSANAFTYTLNDNTKADNYNIDKSEGKLIVRDRDQKYAINVEANSATYTYNGKEQVAEGLKATTFTTSDGGVYTVEGLTARAAGTSAGSYTVEITGEPIVRDIDGNDVTSQFAITETPGTLLIEKAKLTITAGSASKPYDGEPLTAHFTESIEGVVDGEHVVENDLEYDGSQIEIGTSSNAVRRESVRVETTGLLEIILGGEDTTSNYDIQLNPGTLVVEQRYDLSYTVNQIYLDADGNEVKSEVIDSSNEAYYGEKILKAEPAEEVTEDNLHYVFLPNWPDYLATKDKTVGLNADENVVNIYYALDEKGNPGATDPENPTDPIPDEEDGIPDMYQIVFKYVSAGNGTVSGETYETHTFKDDNGDYIAKTSASPDAEVTVHPDEEYAFDYWTIDGSQKDFTKEMSVLKTDAYSDDTTFTVYFDTDTKGGTDPEDPDDNVPDDPDGIPDKYQTIFQYVSGGNGTVSGTTYEVHTFVEDGVYTEASRMPVKPNADVTVSPNTNYRFSNWTFGDQTYADTDAIAAAEFTADATFTANFVRRSTGGGGGGSTSGGGASSVIRTDGTGTVTINPDDVPLAPLPDDGQSVVTEIPEEEVPLFGLPKTGDNSIPVGGLVGMMLASLLGAFGISRKRKGEDEA